MHDLRDVAAVRRKVRFTGNLAAEDLNLVADHRVRRPGKDGVGADQEVSPVAQESERPPEGRKNLLIWSGSRVDDVRGLLHSLELHGIEEETVVALDDVPHGLAAGRRPAAEQGSDAVLGDQPLRPAGEHALVRLSVGDVRFDRSAFHPAVAIEFLDREQGGVDDRCFAPRHHAGQRMQDAHLDGRPGRSRGRGRTAVERTLAHAGIRVRSVFVGRTGDDLRQELVAPASDRREVARRSRVVAEDPAELAYVTSQEIVAHRNVGPQVRQKLALGHQTSGMASQVQEERERLRSQGNRVIAAPELLIDTVQTEGVKEEPSGRHDGPHREGDTRPTKSGRLPARSPSVSVQ